MLMQMSFRVQHSAKAGSLSCQPASYPGLLGACNSLILTKLKSFGLISPRKIHRFCSIPYSFSYSRKDPHSNPRFSCPKTWEFSYFLSTPSSHQLLVQFILYLGTALVLGFQRSDPTSQPSFILLAITVPSHMSSLPSWFIFPSASTLPRH